MYLEGQLCWLKQESHDNFLVYKSCLYLYVNKKINARFLIIGHSLLQRERDFSLIEKQNQV